MQQDELWVHSFCWRTRHSKESRKFWGEGEGNGVVKFEFKSFLSFTAFLTAKPIAKAKEVCNQVMFVLVIAHKAFVVIMWCMEFIELIAWNVEE